MRLIGLFALGLGFAAVGCRTEDSQVASEDSLVPSSAATETAPIPDVLEFFRRADPRNDACTQGLYLTYDSSASPAKLTIEGHVWEESGCDYYDQVSTDPMEFTVANLDTNNGGVTAKANGSGTLTLTRAPNSTSWTLVVTSTPPASDDHQDRNGNYVSKNTEPSRLPTSDVPEYLEFYHDLKDNNDACTHGLAFHYDNTAMPATIELEGTMWEPSNCDYYDQVPTDPIQFKVVNSETRNGSIFLSASGNGSLTLTGQSKAWKLTLQGVPNAPADNEKRAGTYKAKKQ